MSKEKKVSLPIYFILLIGYLIGLVYFLYFSSSFEEISGRLKATGGIFNYVLIVFLLGIYPVSMFYFNVITKLFCPDSELDIKIRELKRSYRENRQKNRKELMKNIIKLKLEHELKELKK